MSDPAPSRSLPPVILVHGFASSFEHNWVRTGWTEALESRGHEVIGLDLPGHGAADGTAADRTAAEPAAADGTAGDRTAAEPAAADQPGGARAAAAQLTALAGRYREVDLVGFSAGARVCAAVAAEGAAPVRRLVLAGLGDGSLEDAPRAADGPISLTGPLDEADIRSALFRRMAASAGHHPAALEAFLAAPGVDITAGLLARISCPTLVIIGERDWLGPADRVMASLPDGRLATLRRADHFGTATHVEAILATLRFLAA
jgi:pimeloyl-ACP methyl ester carboxylesterase